MQLSGKPYRDSLKHSLDSLQQRAERIEKGSIYTQHISQGRIYAEELWNYIQALKDTFANCTGGWTSTDKKTVRNDADIEVSNKFFIGEGRAEQLRQRLQQFNKRVVKLGVDDGTVLPNVTDPPADRQGNRQSWSNSLFDGVPAIAAITLLDKFQFDVRKTEENMVRYNYRQIK